MSRTRLKFDKNDMEWGRELVEVSEAVEQHNNDRNREMIGSRHLAIMAIDVNNEEGTDFELKSCAVGREDVIARGILAFLEEHPQIGSEVTKKILSSAFAAMRRGK